MTYRAYWQICWVGGVWVWSESGVVWVGVGGSLDINNPQADKDYGLQGEEEDS